MTEEEVDADRVYLCERCVTVTVTVTVTAIESCDNEKREDQKTWDRLATRYSQEETTGASIGQSWW